MKLLQLSDDIADWAPEVRIERHEKRELRLRCPACETYDEVVSGGVTVEVQRGSRWPDLIGGEYVGKRRLIVNERVLDVFDQEKVTGYSAGLVEFLEIKSKKLRVVATPTYYILNLEPGIDFVMGAELVKEYVDIPREFVCSCGNWKRGVPKELGDLVYRAMKRVERRMPIMETWNGKDIVDVRQGPTITCCTPKILELAHQHRWSNFLFDMADAVLRHVTRWNGIDYPSKKWPPERWYPPPVSEGKSREEWLDILRNEPFPTPTNHSRAILAYEPLFDFGDEAVSELRRMLAEGNEDQQKNAAQGLRRFWNEMGYPLTEADRQRVVEVLPEAARDFLS